VVAVQEEQEMLVLVCQEPQTQVVAVVAVLMVHQVLQMLQVMAAQE
jgi:hypothetical protein